ncbi:hypothetical protein Ocin01_12107 [Orchesella cincta]|uniref:Uncharacterized protein n=1 Tax=Orchesella cincta TaxID=48709 RepID=A0A1D2MNL4_ORCCI|nr:hypothetical protein Ocin01_12107 [Orchesella cincta]
MRVFNLAICFLLMMSLAYRVYSQSYDDSQTQVNYIPPSELVNSDRVKRSEDPQVDLQVNEGESESGQNENNSPAENEVESSGDETDGNTSDDEESYGDMEQDERSQKQKRHMMDNYIPDDGELQKLMTESSGLAQEVSQVFELLSDREMKLLREMELLKDALSMAVSKLKTSLQTEVTELDDKEKARRQRRDFPYNSKPYKACVSIEPSSPEQQYTGLGQIPPRGPGVGPIPSPTPKVLEFIPGKGDPIITPSPPRNPTSRPSPEAQIKPRGPQGDQVDLSQVVWVRLHPDRKQEELKKKIDTLFKEKQNMGKDVLVIPVDHRLKNTEEVKSQFLHAVRVKPSALKNHNFRQLRSLQIVEY